MYFVLDNDFNRAHYKHLIGKQFENPPPYVNVMKSLTLEEFNQLNPEKRKEYLLTLVFNIEGSNNE